MPTDEKALVYVLRGEAIFGPYPIEQFSQLLAAGEIGDGDYSCLAGDEAWTFV